MRVPTSRSASSDPHEPAGEDILDRSLRTADDRRSMGETSRTRKVLGLVLRVAITGLVFGYLFTRIDAAAVSSSLSRIPPLAMLGSAFALCLAVLGGVVRGGILLDAYGAERRPSYVVLARWYVLAMFYNLLPGGVGGDVVRGMLLRDCFAGRALAGSLGVVFVERILGLIGLMMLSAVATLASATPDARLLAYTAVGILGSGLSIVMLAAGRRLGHLLPGRVRPFATALPTIARPGAFAAAIALTVASQAVLSWSGHVVITSLDPRVTLLDSMAVFPVGALAAYFPFTVAGAGSRDAALVFLFARIGVAHNDALATSLFLLVSHLVISAMGGLVQPFVSLPRLDGGAALDSRASPNHGRQR